MERGGRGLRGSRRFGDRFKGLGGRFQRFCWLGRLGVHGSSEPRIRILDEGERLIEIQGFVRCRHRDRGDLLAGRWLVGRWAGRDRRALDRLRRRGRRGKVRFSYSDICVGEWRSAGVAEAGRGEEAAPRTGDPRLWGSAHITPSAHEGVSRGAGDSSPLGPPAGRAPPAPVRLPPTSLPPVTSLPGSERADCVIDKKQRAVSTRRIHGDSKGRYLGALAGGPPGPATSLRRSRRP